MEYTKECKCGHAHSSHLELGKEADCLECECEGFEDGK